MRGCECVRFQTAAKRLAGRIALFFVSLFHALPRSCVLKLRYSARSRSQRQTWPGFDSHAKVPRRKEVSVLCVLAPLRETTKSLDCAVFPAFETERQKVVSSVVFVPLCFNLFGLASWSLTSGPRFQWTREEKHRGTEGRSLFLRECLWWMHRE